MSRGGKKDTRTFDRDPGNWHSLKSKEINTGMT